jgi:murein DD-endopeptidase / murein LD-carboxypeptidase
VIARARAAVGARFRLHGRDPVDGLDCVGLAAHAFEAAEVPTGYAMRRGDADALASAIADAGLARAGDARDGDLMMLRAGPGQLHLGVAVPGGMVHADATLRRVVERPGAPPWPVLARFRREG